MYKFLPLLLLASCTTPQKITVTTKEPPATIPESLPPEMVEFYSDPVLMAVPILGVATALVIIYLRERKENDDHT